MKGRIFTIGVKFPDDFMGGDPNEDDLLEYIQKFLPSDDNVSINIQKYGIPTQYR